MADVNAPCPKNAPWPNARVTDEKGRTSPLYPGLRCWHGGREHSWEPGESCPPERIKEPTDG